MSPRAEDACTPSTESRTVNVSEHLAEKLCQIECSHVTFSLSQCSWDLLYMIISLLSGFVSASPSSFPPCSLPPHWTLKWASTEKRRPQHASGFEWRGHSLCWDREQRDTETLKMLVDSGLRSGQWQETPFTQDLRDKRSAWQLHVFFFKLVARLEWPMTSEIPTFLIGGTGLRWRLGAEVDNSIFSELFATPDFSQPREFITHSSGS